MLFAGVAAAAPILTVGATDAVVGGEIQGTADLSESPGATGEITFEVFAADDPTCSEPPLDTSTVTVSGEGQYLSEGFVPLAPGTYNWSAHYSGDGENEPAESVCSAGSKVAKATPSLTGNASDGVVGTAIHDEVTVSGGYFPTGEVTFSVYAPSDTTCSTPLETATSPIASGQAVSPNFSPQQSGEFRWTASYSGDANNKTVSLACGAVDQASTVSKASPSLSGTATAAAVAGSPITDEVTLSGGFSPGGEIVFRAYGPDDETCGEAPAYEETIAVNGNGSYSPSGFSPGAGVYRWTASYSGDADNEAVGLTCGAANQTSTVAKATPSLTGNASDGVVGTAIHDEVTLSGGYFPTGEVTFSVYAPSDTTCSTPLETTTSPLTGNKATSANFLPQQAGEFRWTASYSGDANNEAVSLACSAANQASVVSKASPGLSGIATSTVIVGNTITDAATLSGGFAPGGEIVFRAYGPGDQTCASAPAYEDSVAVSGNGPYSPPGFAPGPGLYLWTVEYTGDDDNAAASLACGAANQASAVGTIDVALTSAATGGTVGSPVTATATLREGAIPSGQITFKAFPPGDANCAGAPAFSSSVKVSGNGTYRSAALVPTRVGAYRWTAAYSGDPNHAPAVTGCGAAASQIAQAQPSISGSVPPRVTVGTAFSDIVALQGGFAPRGTITFRIYGPVSSGCAKPGFVNTVAVNGNGTFSSDPFVALRPGRYSFVASYSGDAANKSASEPCDSPTQIVQVGKRKPRVKPRAVLVGAKQISIRARLSGSIAPAGALTFRLYGPGDRRCARKPAFSGGISVKRNGTFSLGRYLATKPGTYRLSVGYSGDKRNQRYKASCSGAQLIRVK
ncbi:MAG TPA: hypothetical protein VLI94_12750 [Solirubrobacterales bacterium]|nr:hypothetical protein [Solirubrobacterales bacterium]